MTSVVYVGDASVSLRLLLLVSSSWLVLSMLEMQLMSNRMQHPKVKKKHLIVCVRERTIPTERPPLVDEVIANFFAYRGCHVVSVTDPYSRILGFLELFVMKFCTNSCHVSHLWFKHSLNSPFCVLS
jgi:hypothetical protein